MSNHTSILDVARAAGVSKTTVSFVLSGKGDEERIAHETQERVRAAARQLNYQQESPAANPAPVVSATVPEGARKIGMVVAVSGPASTLGLVPGQERILDGKGFSVTLVAVTADPVDSQERVGRLLRQGVAGILCCPSVFSAVAAITAGQCPAVAMSPWAAESLVNKLQNPGAVEQSPAGNPAATINPQPVVPISPVVPKPAPVSTPVRPVPVRPVAPSQQEPVIRATPEPVVVPVAGAVAPPATVTPPPVEPMPVTVEVPNPPVVVPVVEAPIPSVEPVQVVIPIVAPPPEPAPVTETPVQPEVLEPPAPQPEPVPVVQPVLKPVPAVAPPPEPVPEPSPKPPLEPVSPPPEVVVEPPAPSCPVPESVSGETSTIGIPETTEAAEGDEVKGGG